MIALVSRMALWVAFAATLLGAAPHVAGPHCRPGSDGHQSAAAHHQHQQEQNDTAPTEQCPHCPPAECRRHTECAAAADLTIVASRTDGSVPVQAAPSRRAQDRVDADPLSPPTPPPQHHS